MPLCDVRYLVGFDSLELPHRLTDVLVVGSGVAGLTAALEAASAGARVLVVTKDRADETLTALAQGGVAVALDGREALEAHIEDTLRTGCGLCRRRVVETILREGPSVVRRLAEWGVKFDREDGGFALAREGGHSVARILRVSGDATGAEIQRVLLARARATPGIAVLEKTFCLDLITEQGRCIGALLVEPDGQLGLVWAEAVVLAAGGAGQVYRETTNSEIATGDGMAMAYRAGATLTDMELVQFHPTTLYIAGAIRALISEAVRGEGAYLLDRGGERFMPRHHRQAELAPRDVVSRAILAEMKRTGDTQVYLSCAHLQPEKIRRRFPGLARLCAAFDIDFARDPVPVRPSAHYFIGGVRTTLSGRTDVFGLFACGETAATGLHGANRLASNSLLEGLVMGARTGRAVLRFLRRAEDVRPRRMTVPPPTRSERILVRDVEDSLRSLMWRQVGIERNAEGLADAAERIGFWCRYVLANRFDTPDGWRLQNMLTVAYLVTRAAVTRRESRGVHYRTDCPEEHPRWRRHVNLRRL